MSVYKTIDNPQQDGERYRRFVRGRFTVVMRFFKDSGGYFNPIHRARWHVHVFIDRSPIGYATANDPRFAVHEAIRAARRLLMWPLREGIWFKP